jgi:hypothetical protein
VYGGKDKAKIEEEIKVKINNGFIYEVFVLRKE